jgi:hypothetical protein
MSIRLIREIRCHIQARVNRTHLSKRAVVRLAWVVALLPLALAACRSQTDPPTRHQKAHIVARKPCCVIY